MHSRIILQLVILRWIELYFYIAIRRRLIKTVQHLRQNGQGDAAPLSGKSLAASGGSAICTQQRYDGNGNLIQIIDDRGGTTTYEYDEQDRLIATIQHDGSRKTSVYNLASDIVQTTDENGSVLNNVYDVLGRKITVNITRASGVQGTTQQSYQYDGLSRPTWHRDSSFESWIYHDSLNRVVEENQNSRYVTNNAFTSLQESEFTYPNNRKVTTEHDLLYRKNEITESSDSSRIAKWHYVGNRTAEVLLGNGLTQTFLNNERTHSQVQSDVPKPAWGSAGSNRLGYDGSGRAIAKRYLAGGIHSGTGAYNDTTPVVGFTTEFDHSGNKMYERELHAETRSSLYQPFDEQGYAQGGYDSLDRLRKVLRGELSASGGYSASGGGKVTQAIALPNTDEERKYLLDGLGNWEESRFIPVGGTPTVDLRQHNKQNQITSRKEETKVLFTYDANGNLKDDGVLLYDYDALNRLTQVRRKSNGQTIGQYGYDAQNRRARKTISNGGLSGNIPSGTTDFIYRDWQVMEERSGSTVNKQYVWGDYVDECIQLRTYVTSGAGNLPAGTYYPLQDLLYRTKALTSSTGDIVEAYDYDPYGNTLIFSEAGAGDNWWADDATQANYAACEILYCGYRFDPESKLYQVRNRQYNPSLGRWIQRDPIGFDGGDWNLYGYLESNTVNDTDVYGLWSLYRWLYTGGPFGGNGNASDEAYNAALDAGAEVVDCINSCTAQHYGLTGSAGTMVMVGQPIPGSKPFVTIGSSKGTSIASAVLSKVFPQRLPMRLLAPTTVNIGARSSVAGRVMGRWIPWIGWALLIGDLTAIKLCEDNCIVEKQCARPLR